MSSETGAVIVFIMSTKSIAPFRNILCAGKRLFYLIFQTVLRNVGNLRADWLQRTPFPVNLSNILPAKIDLIIYVLSIYRTGFILIKWAIYRI